MHKELFYKNEIFRKIIHISSLIFPFLLWLLGKKMFSIYVIPLLSLFIILDFIKPLSKKLTYLYLIIFKPVTRPHEYDSPTGATWVFLGIILTTLIFNQKIAIISLAVLSISDSAAAIIGIRFGKTKLFSKSLEGSFSFFLATILIISNSTSLNTLYLIAFSLIITIFELLNFKINDNVLIPIITASLLYLGGV